jgi:hypothetical protein
MGFVCSENKVVRSGGSAEWEPGIEVAFQKLDFLHIGNQSFVDGALCFLFLFESFLFMLLLFLGELEMVNKIKFTSPFFWKKPFSLFLCLGAFALAKYSSLI